MTALADPLAPPTTTAEASAARVALATLFRAAVLHGYHEGIDNHCSLALPGAPGRFLLNPFGPHWSELRASDLLEVDESGRVIGRGEAETTAFFLHSRLHAARPDAACVVHTHMPYATALACTEGGLDTLLHQNTMRFHGRIGWVDRYEGRIVDPAEGDRIAASVAGGLRVLLLAQHGVLVVAESVAHAWYDLYFLEQAARVQVLAQSTGQPLRRATAAVAARTAEQFDEERQDAPLLWAAVTRQVARDLPGVDG